MLTLLRLAAHVVVGIVMGLLYWDVGNDATRIYNNVGLLFFNQMFILFTAMMPTVLTCNWGRVGAVYSDQLIAFVWAYSSAGATSADTGTPQ